MKKFLNSRFTITIVIILAAILLVSWGVNKYLDMQAELRIAQQNASALQDSVRVQKNRVGDLEYAKEILVANNQRDLKNLNERMANIVREFKGEINELTDLVADIKGDTILINNTSLVNLPDNTSGFEWSYDKVYDQDNERHLAGVTKFKYDSINNLIEPLETLITRDDIKFNLTQGIRTREDGKVEMFASSKYPNFSASELNSVIIDPSTHPALDKFTKKKKFGISIYTGLGATVNLSDYSAVVGPQVGIGLRYDLW